MNVSMWMTATLNRVITDLNVYEDGRAMSGDVLDCFGLSMELVLRELIANEVVGESTGSLCEACQHLRAALQIIDILKAMQEHSACSPPQHTPHPVVHGTFGRPRYDISREQLQYLLENKFTIPQISNMVGVSQRTIHRRMNEFSLSVRAYYTVISDEGLDLIVHEIQSQFPMCGNLQMLGHLHSRGLRVQQVRVRDSLRRVDPEGSMMRRLRTINRRCYRVQAPLSLWHIDGNHKLIR